MPELMNTPSPTKTFVAAFLFVFCYAAGHVGLSYVMEGATLATRTATSLVMPIGLLWLVSIGGTVWFALRRIWTASILMALVGAIVFFTGCNYFSSWMMAVLEWPEQPPPATQDEPLRTAVALGGGVSIGPNGSPELGPDGERIFSVAQLWHTGLTRSIIVTGATPDGRYNPCDVSRDLLLSAGVPEEAIFRIKGENTTQEMQAMKDFLADPPPEFPSEGSIALVTSAFHMQRAIRLSKVQGIDFVPYPCAFRGSIHEGYAPSRWVPGSVSMSNFGLAFKENLAGLVGR